MVYASENKLKSNINNLFPGEILKQYDKNKYPFQQILQSLFNISKLDKIHEKIQSEEIFNRDLGKDSASKLHSIFYSEIKKEDSELRNIWESFLANVVKHHFTSIDSLIVQKLPSLRIHIPKGIAIKRWHCDSDQDHKHPLGELNCILALTDMSDTNSLWRESKPNKKDFKPFNLKSGELVYWNGNTCIHGNKVNESSKTRMSLDFRVFPREEYQKYIAKSKGIENSSATLGTKFNIGGYYKEVF